MVVIPVICVILAGLAALWFSPLRSPLLRQLSCLHRYKFTCKVECLIDESKPINQDKVFCVQMIGRIPTPCNNMDTDVCVDLTDITNSQFHPDLVLSVDEKYRSSDRAGFRYATHNGIIPKKNAILSSWITIVKIPSCQLRFAHRGRRKLLFKISIVSCENDEVLTSDQQTIEYVSCLDGYKELQDRKLEVLKASIELAVGLSNVETSSCEKIKQLFSEWLERKAQTFPASTGLSEWVQSLPLPNDSCEHRQALECLLAYAEQADKLAAIELALQVFTAGTQITVEQFCGLAEVADKLQVKQSRFLALCQKILLFSDCKILAISQLFGIDESMDEDVFRSKLNAEYRKWNSRVTHPDEEIRRQADEMLSLIAELRSQRMGRVCL